MKLISVCVYRHPVCTMCCVELPAHENKTNKKQSVLLDKNRCAVWTEPVIISFHSELHKWHLQTLQTSEPNQQVNKALVTFDCLFVLLLPGPLLVENCAGWCRLLVCAARNWLVVGLNSTRPASHSQFHLLLKRCCGLNCTAMSLS